MSSTTTITTEARGHVFLIGLDRTAKMNAFDPAMLEGLAAAYATLEGDPELFVGVLFAHGPHFTAGLDLAKVAPHIQAGQGLFHTLAGEAAGAHVDPLGLFGPTRKKPVVCAVQGRCLTIGIELALASDIVVASDDTRFGQIEVKRGIFPFGGATLRWIQRSGWGNAMRWLLTGDELDAAEALRIGLVQEVVPAGRQLERAVALAETIARQAPLAVQATLASARQTLEQGFEAARDALYPVLADLMRSDDAREGLMSFMERREARFRGR